MHEILYVSVFRQQSFRLQYGNHHCETSNCIQLQLPYLLGRAEDLDADIQ